MNINLPIIIKKYPISYWVLLTIFIIGIILNFVAFFAISLDYKYIRLSLVIFFGISFLAWVIGNAMIKKYKQIGSFQTSDETIRLFLNNEFKELFIKDFESIKFIITGFEGRRSPHIITGSARFDEGADNIIELVENGKKQKFLFLIKEKSWMYHLNQWVSMQKEKGNNVNIIVDNNVRNQAKKYVK